MKTMQRRCRESGNVLFLILIAVALFAALSYAVTQSSRGGGAGSSSEAALIGSAQITQYPASLRTSILRMMVSGVDVSELVFDPPSDFADNITGNSVLENRAVFYPTGGGATYMEASPDIVAGLGDGAGFWYYNDNFAFPNIGLGDEELTAFLPGVSLGVCRSANRSVGIEGNNGEQPVLGGDEEDSYKEIIMSAASSVDAYTGNNIAFDGGSKATANIPDALIGQPFGCFRNAVDVGGAPEYVYYHVLVER